MAKVDTQLLDIGVMEQLSSGDTPIHRLDPRSKLLATLSFVIIVVSFGKYEISALLPFFVYPIVLAAIADIPVMYLARKILLVSPFAVLIGVFNPMLDREPLAHIGLLTISGGWISFFSILVRFTLTVAAALILLATTGIDRLCLGMERLRVPRVFTIQLLFLYRYMFVLFDEGGRMLRAKAARSFGNTNTGMHTYVNMVGNLLLRSLDRAQRVQMAMTCRGFDGHIRTLRRLHWASLDYVFLVGWLFLLIALRFNNVSRMLGHFIMERLS